MVWSDFLVKKLNVNCVNNAQPGSSNHRIARRTLEDLLTLNLDPKSTMVIIGWSFISRDEIWHDQKNESYNFLDTDIWPDSQFLTADYLRDSKDVDPVTRMKLRFLDRFHMTLDHERQIVHFFQMAFMLIKSLEQMGYKWMMFNAAMQPDIFYKFPYVQKLKQTQFCVNHNNFHWDMSLLEYAKKHNLPMKSTGHLQEEGHKHFVDWIIKKGDLSRP
jgi:hypothetical protein